MDKFNEAWAMEVLEGYVEYMKRFHKDTLSTESEMNCKFCAMKMNCAGCMNYESKEA